MKTSRIALFLLTFALSTFAQVWLQGSVEKISDGDTFRLLSNGQIEAICLTLGTKRAKKKRLSA